jgi:hypothetical protein
MTHSISITAIRLIHIENQWEVSIEHNGKWFTVIAELDNGPVSHIVEITETGLKHK